MEESKDLRIASHFKTILQAEDFLITGTHALKLMGFNIKQVKDLDIILVKPKSSTIDVLQALEVSNPPKNLSTYPVPLEGKMLFRFMHEGVSIDVFIRNEGFKYALQTKSGISIAPLDHIISAKKSMRRPKDMVQLLALRNTIISSSEFSSYVGNVLHIS